MLQPSFDRVAAQKFSAAECAISQAMFQPRHNTLACSRTRSRCGQAGVYLVHDPAVALDLPPATASTPSLVLAPKQYNAGVALFSTVRQRISLWGDVIHVNRHRWPFLNVEQRKYRFLVFNAAVSRKILGYFVKTAMSLPSVRSRLFFAKAGGTGAEGDYEDTDRAVFRGGNRSSCGRLAATNA
ncbi:hypothetical protein B0T21DRAFT_352590 [Apiosordaria backusii]|uniref:Uncharacterized protein n=1 Tax=Apiosordaria backusii TaxID=314023 RepID=A0AA40A6T9_9PEZI|nr:hypothetical protein B0T21DRAFT_352590 [Apiosordaria backusii]